MDLIGTVLGNYRIDRLLGEGGMGTVYRAYDLSLQRDVAIKLIHPHLARRQDFRERFIHEARMMARLDHPGIVKVFAFGKEGDLFYLPMEFIRGGNLRQLLDKLIREQKWIPLNEALLLMQQLCQIVEYAHQQGVLHRDIKPANLMLKPEPNGGLPFRIILTDLGLAKLAEGLGITQEGTSLGTPAYMSPEQALGQETDRRSDVYSLGVLLYELAVGRLPFGIRSLTEAAHYHTQVQPPAPRSIRPDLPEAVERVILTAMEKDPAKRYTSVADLGTALAATLIPATEILDQPVEARVSLVNEFEPDLAASPQPEYASLMTILENESSQPRGASVFGDQSIPSSPEARLQIIDKDKTARVITLPPGTVTMGRTEDNTIVLEDEKASRKHAQITWDGVQYQVMDLNSRNGTFLENDKLLPGIPEILRPGQNLRIGDTWLRLLEPSMKASSIVGEGSVLDSPSIYMRSGIGVVAVQVIPQHLEVEAGGVVTATISLLNQSPNVDHFSLSITGVPSTWVASLQSSVELMPADKKEESFTLQVPRVSQSRAGPYPLILKVTSQRDPSQSAEVKLTLTVAAYSQFRAELQPQRLRAGQNGRLTLSNQGNLTENFTVNFKDAADELTFQPPQLQVRVPEGGSATAEYRARPRQLRLLGGEKSHSFSAQVSLPKGEPLSMQAELLSRGLIPVWIPPIVLLLCCLLMVTGARFLPPILFPTPTSTLTPALTATITPSATIDPGAPNIEEWCIYPSDQSPTTCTNSPFQVRAIPGQTLIIQWRVSNAEEVILTPGGNQGLSGSQTYVVTENMQVFTLKANNAQKTIEKQIQVIVDPPTPTLGPPTADSNATLQAASKLTAAAQGDLNRTATAIANANAAATEKAMACFTGNWVPASPTNRDGEIAMLVINRVNQSTFSYDGFYRCSGQSCPWADPVEVPANSPRLVGTLQEQGTIAPLQWRVSVECISNDQLSAEVIESIGGQIRNTSSYILKKMTPLEPPFQTRTPTP